MQDSPLLKQGLQKLAINGLLAIVMMVTAILIFSPYFSAIIPHSKSTSFALAITHSAGIYGTLIGVIIACLLYTINEQGIKSKLTTFVKAFIGIALVIASFAFVNEKITKPLIKAERPSHSLMLSLFHQTPMLDSLYNLSKVERVNWFSKEVNKRPYLQNGVDPNVLTHWVEEGGYSFPSGHTFNAFLLAIIFAFGIGHNQYHIGSRKLFPLPFIWAASVGISRVALGVHTLTDVTVGALMGIVLGLLLLWIDETRHLITHKKFV